MSAASAPTIAATPRAGIAAARLGDRRAMLVIATQQVLFGLLPLIVVAVVLSSVFSNSQLVATDFRGAYWSAGYRVLHGGHPYAWTLGEIRGGAAFVYPALSAIIFIPAALVPRGAAALIVLFACMALTPLTLRVLGVRDWRVYGAALIWGPVLASWQSGNETILLVMMTAVAWRYRDRPWVVAALTAAAISMKPFMWPLALWLLAARRWRAAAYMLISGLVLNLAAWAILGFNQISAYLHAASLDTQYTWREGYSVTAVASHLGLDHVAGEILMVLISVAVAAGVVYCGYIKRRQQQALILTVALMLIASPLVWSHYFALLLIPLAIERPRFSWVWALPLAMLLCPESTAAVLWQELVAWAVAGVALGTLARSAQT